MNFPNNKVVRIRSAWDRFERYWKWITCKWIKQMNIFQYDRPESSNKIGAKIHTNRENFKISDTPYKTKEVWAHIFEKRKIKPTTE